MYWVTFRNCCGQFNLEMGGGDEEGYLGLLYVFTRKRFLSSIISIIKRGGYGTYKHDIVVW